jgi:hypothetical protein
MEREDRMISQDIRATVRTLLDLTKEDQLTKKNLLDGLEILLDCSVQVERLESRPVPAHYRAAGDNVIQLDFGRSAVRELTYVPDGPGGVA